MKSKSAAARARDAELQLIILFGSNFIKSQRAAAPLRARLW